MVNRKIVGIILIIVGLFFSLLQVFGNYYLPGIVPYLIGIPCIIIGIYISISKPKPLPEWRKDLVLVKKRSFRYFIIGSILIGVSCLIIIVDLGFRLGGSWSGIYLFLDIPLYLIGLILIVYTIHIFGNEWGWLDFPLAIVIFIFAILQVLWSHGLIELAYRLAWLSVFPLNYIPLLLLYILLVRKNTVNK